MATIRHITINGKTRPTSAYNRFNRMLQRCVNPADAGYPEYGGRGIKVCEGWQLFENFIADMGEPPSPAHSLDRIDNNGHYSCGKCSECTQNGWPINYRWATPLQQANNTRANVRITKDGKTLTIRGWAKELGISEGTLFCRRARGMSDEQILAPVRPRRAYERKRRGRSIS